jgi:hypothetical protein
MEKVSGKWVAADTTPFIIRASGGFGFVSPGLEGGGKI